MLHVGAFVSISSQPSGNNGFNHDPISRRGMVWFNASSCPPASTYFNSLRFERPYPLGNLHVNVLSRRHKQFPLLPTSNPSIEYTIDHPSYNHRQIIQLKVRDLICSTKFDCNPVVRYAVLARPVASHALMNRSRVVGGLDAGAKMGRATIGENSFDYSDWTY